MEGPHRRRVAVVVAVVAGLFAAALAAVAVLVDAAPLRDAERAATDGTGDWPAYLDPEGAFVVELPAAAEPDATRTPAGDPPSPTVSVGRVLAAVRSHRYEPAELADGGADLLLGDVPRWYGAQLDGRSGELTSTVVDDRRALSFRVDADSGVWRVTAVLDGDTLYLLAIGSPEDPVGGADRMRTTFDLDPTAPPGGTTSPAAG